MFPRSSVVRTAVAKWTRLLTNHPLLLTPLFLVHCASPLSLVAKSRMAGQRREQRPDARINDVEGDIVLRVFGCGKSDCPIDSLSHEPPNPSLASPSVAAADRTPRERHGLRVDTLPAPRGLESLAQALANHTQSPVEPSHSLTDSSDFTIPKLQVVTPSENSGGVEICFGV
ncbi:hypothetical protein B0H16DRAFT_1591852 [Mycena metata]|uniref:Uncharacterized protein n=1 Tax=Mycena metata TaxID=1033252 RepID=A0AAD7HRW4_9AGAR|nr:hypothetical protein B0H16DRAFT_1591852 [Mycena metata]